MAQALVGALGLASGLGAVSFKGLGFRVVETNYGLL